MLRPDAGVDDADDDVGAGVDLAAEGRPDGRGTDERRVVVEGMLQRVLLDGDDAGRLEEVGDLVRGQCRRHAAIGGAEGRPDLHPGDGLLGPGADVLRPAGGVAVVGLHGGRILREGPAGGPGAGGGEAVDAPGVRGGHVEVVLDHDVDRRRVLAAEEGRIGLRDRAGGRLRPDERRVRREGRRRELRWVHADGDAREEELSCQQAQHGQGNDDPSH